MKKYIVTLNEEERKTLSDIASKGNQRSQKILNALILLGCDKGEYQTEHSTNEEISRVLHISMRKIDRVKSDLSKEVSILHLIKGQETALCQESRWGF